MIKVGIIGGTGYTGIELLRILHGHPSAEVVFISSRSLDGKRVDEIFPSLKNQTDLCFSSPSAEETKKCDVVFFATPHGVAMEGASELLSEDIKVIDLGADFRITDNKVWSEWYGMDHTKTDLLKEVVYGLPENYRDEIKSANLIANPGCYPTSVQLALKPLIENELIHLDNIIADCKSGVSGAGRGANQGTLLCETSESFKAYAVGGHRHYPEIKQELENMAGKKVGLTFIPHLTPMIRGIHSTIYVDLIDKNTDVLPYFLKTYSNEPFVTILSEGEFPETRSVKSSNFCQIAIQKSADNEKLVILSVIDNLVKGASGQAVQNMNIMFGLEETMGLESIGLLP